MRPALMALLIALPTLAWAMEWASDPRTQPYITPPVNGTIDLQYTGKIDGTAPVQVLNLDGFDTSAELVATLLAKGVYPVCYINAGATENWRPDIADFPAQVVGKAYEGWEGEHWLDIRRIDLIGPIISKRMDMCKAKGFLGIDPDNLDGYQTSTGFDLTENDQLKFLYWLANTAHTKGLAIGLKNAPEFAERLANNYDWALTESCFDQGWCEDMRPFAALGKPVYMVEYTDNKTSHKAMCAHAKKLGFIGVLKHRELDGSFRKTCN
ncbi:MAG: endo alpha-1,4 polygalactosaminidase [Alphaproteobacteria bacterium]|nr:endo alpha-1,4 polygalactosaminidase [Alphaproteobacteria bacterium]